MKKTYFLFAFLTVLFTGCSDDDTSTSSESIGVAFVNQTINITDATTAVEVVFSKNTTASGTVNLNITPTNVTYGTDFTTTPAASGATLSVPFVSGVSQVSFSFSKLIDALEGETKNVKFTIASVEGITTTTDASTDYVQLNFNQVAVTNNTLTPNIGGNTFPNNVYIDLSSGQTTDVERTKWEIGFYSGNEFRVVLNPSVNKLAVKQLNTTNIDEVQVEDTAVTTGNYQASSAGYIDYPSGDLNLTTIAEVSDNDSENKVYLVNLGQTVATANASGSSVALTGDARGWKKIRILKDGGNYKLQYADIDATTHNEVVITKNSSYNLIHFSLVNGTEVTAQPQTANWDLKLGAFMNYTSYGGADLSYFYSDFVMSNRLGGTRAYQVVTSTSSYADFTLSNVDSSLFDTAEAIDRRAIGSSWRSTYPSPSLKTDRFYVVKDSAGNIYKLQFTAMLNAAGERGNITFEYTRLN